MTSGFSRRARSRPSRPFSAPSGWNFSSLRIMSRLRRISDESSMTRIFFMGGLRLGLAELQVWEAASANAALRAEVRRSLTPSRFEAWLVAGLTAVAAGALVMGAAALLNFLLHWEHFVSLVQAAIG